MLTITPTDPSITASGKMSMEELFDNGPGLLIVPTVDPEIFCDTHLKVVQLGAVQELLQPRKSPPILSAGDVKLMWHAILKATKKEMKARHAAKQQGTPFLFAPCANTDYLNPDNTTTMSQDTSHEVR